MTEDVLDRLHAVLLAMCDGLVERLAVRIDGGDLALLGSVGGALAAVEDLLQDDRRDAAALTRSRSRALGALVANR
jgi:hypothetical protein